MSKTFVVTGASGFIGRHLVGRLVRDGHTVRAMSRRGMDRDGVTDIVLRDYAEAKTLDDAMQDASAVFHLAARAHQVDESSAGDGDALYRQANVHSAMSVARAARAAGVGRFVLISSIGVNGSATTGAPFRPDDVPRPIEPYARSKWEAEQAIAALLADGSTDYVILRPPLVYGAGCPGNFEKLLKLVARAPLLPLGGITSPRTLIHVDNLVDALVVAAIHPQASRRTFLVTDPRDIHVAEIVRTLAEGLGKPRHTVIDVPASWLAGLARLAGKQAAWEKLTASLQVDGSEFSRATGWRAPVQPRQGLLDTGRQYAASSY